MAMIFRNLNTEDTEIDTENTGQLHKKYESSVFPPLCPLC